MAISAFVLGLINIAIICAALILGGLVIEMILTALKFPPSPQMRSVYLLIVALIAIYMFASLVFGLPMLRIV